MRNTRRFFLLVIISLYLLNFVICVNAGGKVVITFPERKLSLPLKSEIRHIGISSDIKIEILENGEAKYSATLIFFNYHGYGPEIREVYTRFAENGSLISNETRYGRMDVGCNDMPPITYRLALHPNFQNLKVECYPNVEFISKPDIYSNPLELNIRPLNISCNSSFNLTVDYDVPNYLTFDEASGSLILFAYQGINQSGIPLKYYNSTIQIILPYSKNPEKTAESYMPFVAYPFGDLTYDKDMQVKIIQEDPLIIELQKELMGSDSPLISLIPIKLLQLPQLKIRQQDIVDLAEGKRFCSVDVTNNYKDRDLFYVLRDKLDGSSDVIIQSDQEINIQTDRISPLPKGETKEVFQEKLINNNIHLLTNSATETYLLANYLKSKGEPTDFYVDYFMTVEVPKNFILDEENSYLEVTPTEERRMPIFFFFLETAGTHKISTAPVSDKKIVKFHRLTEEKKYETDHILTLMNTPAYELNVTYFLTLKEDPEIAKTRWDIIVFQFLFALIAPIFCWKSEKWKSKHTGWTNKEIYYLGFIIFSLYVFWDISIRLGSTTHWDYFISNKFLWLMLLIFLTIMIKENVFSLKDFLKRIK